MNPYKEYLKHCFTYHAPTAEQIPQYEKVRAQVGAAAIALNDLKEELYKLAETAPYGYERNIAEQRIYQSINIDHLQEVVFWLNAAIARGGMQVVETASPDDTELEF